MPAEAARAFLGAPAHPQMAFSIQHCCPLPQALAVIASSRLGPLHAPRRPLRADTSPRLRSSPATRKPLSAGWRW